MILAGSNLTIPTLVSDATVLDDAIGVAVGSCSGALHAVDVATVARVGRLQSHVRISNAKHCTIDHRLLPSTGGDPARPGSLLLDAALVDAACQWGTQPSSLSRPVPQSSRAPCTHVPQSPAHSSRWRHRHKYPRGKGGNCPSRCGQWEVVGEAAAIVLSPISKADLPPPPSSKSELQEPTSVQPWQLPSEVHANVCPGAKINPTGQSAKLTTRPEGSVKRSVSAILKAGHCPRAPYPPDTVISHCSFGR